MSSSRPTSSDVPETPATPGTGSHCSGSAVGPNTRIPFRRTMTGELAEEPKMASTIGAIFRDVDNPTGFSWNLTPEEVKAEYFDEFRKYYSWEVNMEKEVYKKWEAKARVRFSGFINYLKGLRRKSSRKPDCVKEGMWNGLCAHWTKPEVVAKSQKCRDARLSESDGPGSGISKHRGGSKSVKLRVQEMAEARGIPLKDCAYESFKSIHMKKDGTFMTQKDANIDARVNEIAAEQGEEADLNKIFINVVSEMESSIKKRRIYGKGSLGPSLLSDGSSANGETTSHFRHEQCQTRIGSLEERLDEERRQREELQAQVQALIKKMDQWQSGHPD